MSQEQLAAPTKICTSGEERRKLLRMDFGNRRRLSANPTVVMALVPVMTVLLPMAETSHPGREDVIYSSSKIYTPGKERKRMLRLWHPDKNPGREKEVLPIFLKILDADKEEGAPTILAKDVEVDTTNSNVASFVSKSVQG